MGGTGVGWVLDALQRGVELTFDEVREAFDTTDWDHRWTLERQHDELREARGLVRPFEVVETEADDEAEHAIVAGADGKRWMVTAWPAPSRPDRLKHVRVIPAPPDGTLIRDAVPEDGPALAELERRSPLRLGEGGAVRVTFDRGDDYFRSARLMEDATIYVAEVDGVLAGVYWGAQQPVRIDGANARLFLEMHVRIDPGAPRGGVFWALCVYGRDTYARTSDSIAFWVSPENLAVRKFVADNPSWSVQGVRALIPCSPGAEDIGRWATADDAAPIADVLNACHGRSELYLPHTAASLADRLTRDPDQYSWGEVRVAGGAAIGVGRHRLGVTREADGSRTSTVRAHALDHGFEPGAEGDYRALLRWWASRLAEEGVTHLAVFTSVGSPTHDVVMDLAEKAEPYDLWTFEFDEPPGLVDRGVYVDPVYF